MTTSPHTTTRAPAFDPELREVLRNVDGHAIAVGIRPDTVLAERAAVEQQIVSYADIAADPRFELSVRTAPGTGGNPSVELLVASPATRREGRPVLFVTHGGGLIFGNARYGLPGMLDLAADLDALVVSVEYRLAPEHPFPAAHDDAWAALLWTIREAAELDADPTSVVLCGGSAGANLAAGLALRARDTGEVTPRGQLLIYPMLDDRNDTPSARQMHGIGVWDDVSNRTAWESVRGPAGHELPAYAAPARADSLAALPPTYLEVGSAETFRDETVAYAQRIWSCGGDAELHVWPGAFHGFDLFAPTSTVARRARTARREWLHRLLQDDRQ
ncbi:alpha/beta hydrolase [Actinokineospora sp. G85]|uniref:alpha/beta hydrolase n=1 Tax=Actinokineospora sp. G85 TaxID=3406626 RepID=UPI003C747BE8